MEEDTITIKLTAEEVSVMALAFMGYVSSFLADPSVAELEVSVMLAGILAKTRTQAAAKARQEQAMQAKVQKAQWN